MEWKIGIVPQHVWKDANPSAQDLRTAMVANVVSEQAEERRTEAEAKRQKEMRQKEMLEVEMRQEEKRRAEMRKVEMRKAENRAEKMPRPAAPVPQPRGQGRARTRIAPDEAAHNATRNATHNANNDAPRQPMTPSQYEQTAISLLRRFAEASGRQRRCAMSACRRHRRCSTLTLECHSHVPERPRTPEQEQNAIAYLRRLIERRRAELEKIDNSRLRESGRRD